MKILSDSIVVVGASLAGISTVDALRMRGCDRPIILIGAEPYLPYDRPPLSKSFLSNDKEPVPTLLREEARFAELGVEVRLGAPATGLDLERRMVHTATGSVEYSDLVIATGADARPNPVATDLDGFFPLRTVEDARKLRTALDAACDVVVLGAGFIGAEVAVAARDRGLTVTMVERLQTPMSTALGDEVGALLARLHTDQGVEVRCGTTIVDARGKGHVQEVVLSDGSALPADLVVVGLGVTPNTQWLADSGLDVEDGVLCDENLRAVGHDHIYAVGDVARWPHPLFGETIRVEHWTNATDHAEVVASQLVGTGKIANAVPYVWSDQYGHRIQIVGSPRFADGLTIRENPNGVDHVVVYERQGAVIAVLTINTPRAMVQGRRAITSGMRAADFLATL